MLTLLQSSRRLFHRLCIFWHYVTIRFYGARYKLSYIPSGSKDSVFSSIPSCISHSLSFILYVLLWTVVVIIFTSKVSTVIVYSSMLGLCAYAFVAVQFSVHVYISSLNSNLFSIKKFALMWNSNFLFYFLGLFNLKIKEDISKVFRHGGDD